MGWNTWSTQGKTERDYCDENEVKGVAIALQQSGLQDIGFKHVALDDCWGFPNRTADGHLQADPSRFPKGIKELADWLHARNFTVSKASPCTLRPSWTLFVVMCDIYGAIASQLLMGPVSITDRAS